jgi:hypothetical protein
LEKKDEDLKTSRSRVAHEFKDTAFTNEEEYQEWRAAALKQVDKQKIDQDIHDKPIKNVEQMNEAKNVINGTLYQLQESENHGSNHTNTGRDGDLSPQPVSPHADPAQGRDAQKPPPDRRPQPSAARHQGRGISTE